MLTGRRCVATVKVVEQGAKDDRQYNGSEMAAGDAQRVWFPEMIERLGSQWHQDMSFDAIVKLRDELDEML